MDFVDRFADCSAFLKNTKQTVHCITNIVISDTSITKQGLRTHEKLKEKNRQTILLATRKINGPVIHRLGIRVLCRTINFQMLTDFLLISFNTAICTQNLKKIKDVRFSRHKAITSMPQKI